MMVEIEGKMYKQGDIRRKVEESLLEISRSFDDELSEIYERLLKGECVEIPPKSIHKDYRHLINKFPKEAIERTMINKLYARGKIDERIKDAAERFNFMLFEFDENYFWNNRYIEEIFSVKRLKTPEDILNVAQGCNTCINPYLYKNEIEKKNQKLKYFELWPGDEGTLFLEIDVKSKDDALDKIFGYSRVYFYIIGKKKGRVAAIDSIEYKENPNVDIFKALSASTLCFLCFADIPNFDYILPSSQMITWLSDYIDEHHFNVRGGLIKIGVQELYYYSNHLEYTKNKAIAADCVSQSFRNSLKELLSKSQ